MTRIGLFVMAGAFLFAGCGEIDDEAPEIVLVINPGFASERTITVGAKRMPAYIDGHQTISRRFGKVSHIGIMWYATSKVMPGGKAIALQVLTPSRVPKHEIIVCHVSSAVPFLLNIDAHEKYIVSRGVEPVPQVGSKYRLAPGAYHILVKEYGRQAESR